MKSILWYLLAMTVMVSASVYANPIYMKYDGVDGSFQVEVKNGKATLNKLKPGTYQVSLVFTGRDAKGKDGNTRSSAHVKAFSGRSEFAGGVRVATGDVNGDGRADLAAGNTKNAAYGGGGSTGKVQMQDFHFVMRSSTGQMSQGGMGAGKVSIRDFNVMLQSSGFEVTGQLGTIELKAPEGKAGIDSFFDVFTEIDFN